MWKKIEQVCLPNSLDALWVPAHLHSSGELPSKDKRVGSFRWKDILKLLDSFKGLAMVNIRDGKTCLFWEDLWLNKVPRIHYPHLYSFAKNKAISLHEIKSSDDYEDFLQLPLSPIAADQLIDEASPHKR